MKAKITITMIVRHSMRKLLFGIYDHGMGCLSVKTFADSKDCTTYMKGNRDLFLDPEIISFMCEKETTDASHD
jgi:hypothetical protein